MKYIVSIIILFLSLYNSFCQIDKSLVLNGCTDFLEIAESDLLDYNNALSIEAWIAPNCDDSNRIIVGKEWCEDEWSYYLSVQKGKLYWGFSSDGDCVPSSIGFRSLNQVISNDIFTHVAVVHGQSDVKLFVNGVEVAGTYVAGSFNQIFNSNQEFRIGAYKGISGNFGNYFSGLIDELRVWDIPLTQGMIQSNMNNTLSGNENGLILYLDMESSQSGSSVTLSNQANIAESLVAKTVGFTSETPYFINPTNYSINPINFLDQYFICDEDLILILGNNNYKSIIWSTGSQSNSTSISNSGTYSVTIETELCKYFSHTFEVIKLEKVWTEENVYICSEDTYEYQGQLLPPNSSVEFILSGIGGCDTTLTINVFELPEEETSFLGNDIISCSSMVTLTSPYINTIWNNNFIGSELTVNTEGIYFALAADALGCKFVDTIEVFFDIPFKEINVEICKDDLYPFNGELLPVNTSSTFLIENPDGCDTSFLVNVLEIPVQQTPFLGDNIISCNNPVIVVSPYENTIWNNGFMGSGLWVDEEGEYYATATDEFGCSLSDTISVSFELPFKEITVEICKDDLYPFNGQLLETNTSSTFLIEYMSGCDTTFTIHVLEIPPEESTFLGEDIVSCTQLVILISPFENTTWNGDINSAELIVSQAGIYYASATDELGCSFTDSILVSIETPSKEITVEICKNDFYLFNGVFLEPNTSSTFLVSGEEDCDTIVLINVMEIPLQESSFLGDDIISCTDEINLVSPFQNTVWNDEVLGNELLVDSDGLHFAVATDEMGCSYFDSISVSFEINRKDISVSICKDDFYQFYGELLPPNSVTTLIIQSENGCDTTANITVNALESLNIFEETTISICQNEIILQSPFDSTQWNNEIFGREYTVQSEGQITVNAIDENGCLLTDTIYVEFLNAGFYLPNVIAKNSQINNCFKPTFSDNLLHIYSLQVYDRWGNLVFNEKGLDITWCGYFGNKKVADGVYVYVIELDDNCDSKVRKMGTITVI